MWRAVWRAMSSPGTTCAWRRAGRWTETVSLVVEDGGRLNGRTTMMKQDGTPKPRPKEDLQFGRNYKAEEEEEGAQ